MAGYQGLRVWQLGIEITKSVYRVTADFPSTECYGLTSQLRRCAVSIPSNIAEGHSRESKKELNRFCLISRGSVAELETQLIIAREIGYGDTAAISELMNDLKEEGRMLSGLCRSLRES